MKKLLSSLLVLSAAFTLASCNGGSGSGTGGQPTGGTNNPTGPGTTEKLFDISTLKDDIVLTEDNLIFIETSYYMVCAEECYLCN